MFKIICILGIRCLITIFNSQQHSLSFLCLLLDNSYVSTSFLHVSCGMSAHPSLDKALSWVRLVGLLAITLVPPQVLIQIQVCTQPVQDIGIIVLEPILHYLGCIFQITSVVTKLEFLKRFIHILIKDPDVILLSCGFFDLDNVCCATGREASLQHYVFTTMLDRCTVFFGFYASLFFFQMYSAFIWPNNFNVVSSDDRMIDQKQGSCFR